MKTAGFLIFLFSLMIGCASLTPESPNIEPPIILQPTPLVIPDPISDDNQDLRTLTIDHPQLAISIQRMNQVIDLCNATPPFCQDAEVMIRINAMNSAINTVLQQIGYLQPTPTPGAE
jgi:hypothetical protein